MKNNRTTKTGAPTFSGVPSVDDARLVKIVLTLSLGERLRGELTNLLPMLEPGKFGQLKKPKRDALLRLAVESGALRREAPMPKKGIHVSPSFGYEERHVRGTDVAEAIVAWQSPHAGGVMPVPPPRILASLKAAKPGRSERRSA